MFPLSHVLLPGMPLPLHIFEPRYRQLLADVQEGPGTPSFGVVALRRGSEVGPLAVEGPDELMAVGTLAEILEVETYDDGASDLLAVGSRRFRVCELVTDAQPYPCAKVEWIDEDDGVVPAGAVSVARRLARDYAKLIETRTGREPQEELPRDANLLSYYLAGHLPLTTTDRQALLEDATAADRLRRAIVLLRRETALLELTGTIAISPSVLRLAAHVN